ncbi:MAG: hypothetical protein Q9173_007226 [Seirophora scorigena]
MSGLSMCMVPEMQRVTIQSPLATPTRSPSKRPIMITQAQKQALIDNLQLEITERARKLRAQYALQAQSLRARIELRVNRIPTAMRKANMGELYDKYLESIEQATEPVIQKSTPPAEAPKQPPSPSKSIAPSPTKHTEHTPVKRGTKRSSDHFSADDDKENTPDPAHPLSTKKRPKPNTAHLSNPSAVLSPKSLHPLNHQNHVRVQLGSPQKSCISHLTSPLKPSGGLAAPKPASPAKAAATVTSTAASSAGAANQKPRATRTRAAAARPAKAPAPAALKAKPAPITRAKRGAETRADGGRNESRTVSAASNTSTGTTVVRKAGRGAAASGAKTKAKEGAGKGAGKKGAAAAVEAPAQGKRVLRKRG